MILNTSVKKFYTIFVDFRDAFGSLHQVYLIKTLLESGTEKEYCLLNADIYQESHFLIYGIKELSEVFLLTKGTKTGCPLSSILFIIDLDKKSIHMLS